MSDTIVQCNTHGKQTMAFICHHLLDNAENIGFNEFEIEDQDHPDAWCNACHEQWKNYNHSEEEQEKWETLVDFRIVCGMCYSQKREKNTTALHYDLSVSNTAEILAQLQLKESNNLNLPSYLPKEYTESISHFKTQLISIECQLLNNQDAIALNKSDKEWIFATSIGQEYWAFNNKGEIVFYEMIDEELTPKPLKISFDEWLELAFLFRKLDRILEQYLVTLQLKELLQNQLARINPILVEPFKNYI